MNKWIVYIPSGYEQWRIIEEVYFMEDCDAEYVRNSLINHDGLNANIQVRLAKI